MKTKCLRAQYFFLILLLFLPIITWLLIIAGMILWAIYAFKSFICVLGILLILWGIVVYGVLRPLSRL